MNKPNYCISDGNCEACKLSAHGRDCANEPIKESEEDEKD